MTAKALYLFRINTIYLDLYFVTSIGRLAEGFVAMDYCSLTEK